ncbi:hypothetical protein [Geomicrobium sediminis]|uniref:Uncharacterized protein n=1 Tax=Geomicrobium sediminis TaxID=1347788 RepID=A0ABS2PG64_9BACL|nr:hypothetical protein [Geomicrobium sediminis]MBM7634428.1 hypothetical protein [Geomicrobium sediminis]
MKEVRIWGNAMVKDLERHGLMSYMDQVKEKAIEVGAYAEEGEQFFVEVPGREGNRVHLFCYVAWSSEDADEDTGFFIQWIKYMFYRDGR